MSKRIIVNFLNGPALRAAAKTLQLEAGGNVGDCRDRISRSRRVSVDDLVLVLPGDALKDVCRGLATHFDRRVVVSGSVSQLRARVLEELSRGVEPPEEDEELLDDEEIEEADEAAATYRSDDYRTGLLEELAFRGEGPPARVYQQAAVKAARAGLSPTHPILVQIATGGGKTRVGNDVVAQTLATEPGWALWVTKDWRLLAQAAKDAGQRHARFEGKLRRLGGDGTALHPLVEARATGGILYTTLQTLVRRMGDFSRQRPALVVWDECHWGEYGKSGRRLLRWCKEKEVPVLGLTATPRPPESSRFRGVFHKDFASLVKEGFLSKPIVETPISTGVRWAPHRYGDSDFAQESLRELAENHRRNQLIVNHYDSAKHAKTIVFACNIAHADELGRLFKRRGVPAGVVHNEVPTGQERQILRDFQEGRVQVIVNVGKLTTGIDVPDTRSVFLCRPTLSDVLFSQMVGRASRRHPPSNKTTFQVVEFTDNIEKFGEQLQRPQSFFSGVGNRADEERTPRLRRFPRGKRLKQNAFDPKGEPRWTSSEGLPSDLHGLWYRQGQSFGVELEFTRDDFEELSDRAWTKVAEALRSALAEALPGYVAAAVFNGYRGGGVTGTEKDHGVWNVERDGTCGWEVTSRVLQNEEGFAELALACDVLGRVANELGLEVNHRTGAHVHLGWLGRSLEEVKRAVQAAALFEPALGTLVAPSRLAAFEIDDYDLDEPNGFCKPVSDVLTAKKLATFTDLDGLLRFMNPKDKRYLTLNVKPLASIHTVEVRLHSGTWEAAKLLPWVSLWQQILWIASSDRVLPPVADREVIEPDGDIVALLRKYGPVERPGFLERLHRRRLEVARLWQEHPSLRRWVRFADKWQAP